MLSCDGRVDPCFQLRIGVWVQGIWTQKYWRFFEMPVHCIVAWNWPKGGEQRLSCFQNLQKCPNCQLNRLAFLYPNTLILHEPYNSSSDQTQQWSGCTHKYNSQTTCKSHTNWFEARHLTTWATSVLAKKFTLFSNLLRAGLGSERILNLASFLKKVSWEQGTSG